MANCGQACPYNTLDGCKVKEYNAICPLTNMATPVTEYRMTNADRIRAMSDEELAKWIHNCIPSDACDYCEYSNGYCDGSPCRGKTEAEIITEWLKQPAEDAPKKGEINHAEN